MLISHVQTDFAFLCLFSTFVFQLNTTVVLLFLSFRRLISNNGSVVCVYLIYCIDIPKDFSDYGTIE